MSNDLWLFDFVPRHRRVRHVESESFLVGFAALTLSLGAQQTGSPPSPSGGGSQGGNTQPPSQPPAQSDQTPVPTISGPSEQPSYNRGPVPILLAGKVRLDDSSIPSEPVPIERYCLGHAVVEDHTDRKGRFSFQLGGDPFRQPWTPACRYSDPAPDIVPRRPGP